MAASTDSREEGAPLSEINVTPFVDVVLVLLVIFMVTAPAIMKDTLGIQLPKAKSSDTKALITLGIAVTRQGQILLAGQMVADDVLTQEIKKTLATQPDAQAIISADGDAKHSDVVRAIDLVKLAGINRFALQIDRTTTTN